jgi:hypothetical protein
MVAGRGHARRSENARQGSETARKGSERCGHKRHHHHHHHHRAGMRPEPLVAFAVRCSTSAFDDDRSFIVLTETKFSFRCIPVWDRYSPHRTRVEKKKTHVIMLSP